MELSISFWLMLNSGLTKPLKVNKPCQWQSKEGFKRDAVGGFAANRIPLFWPQKHCHSDAGGI